MPSTKKKSSFTLTLTICSSALLVLGTKKLAEN